MSKFTNNFDDSNYFGPDLETQSKTEEPNWLMGIPKLTKSKIEGFKNFAEIYDHEFAMNRGIEPTISKDIMKPNGGLVGHDLKIIAPSSSVNADIHSHFYQNVPLRSVTLQRIGRINKNIPQALETYIFTQCYITFIKNKGDLLKVHFRYSGVERKTPELKKDGTSRGIHSAQHSFMSIKSGGGKKK